MHQDQPFERTCADCHKTFLYTVAEQQFRAEQGMAEPARCPACRAQCRAQRNADLINGNDANGSSDADERDRRRGRRRRNSQQTNPQDRFPAVCADCGKHTMVPFKPRGDRPVYCRDCYNARRGR